MREVFRRFSNFSCTSNHFSDFSHLDLMFAEAHARGFAPLWCEALSFTFLSAAPSADFDVLKIDYAEAHARGFAPLWPVARGNRYGKVAHFGSKK